MYRVVKIGFLVSCFIVSSMVLGFVEEQDPLEIRLVQFGEAEMERFEGRSLAGVVVEIESSEPGEEILLGASSINAKSSEDKMLPAIVMFVAGGDEGIVSGEVVSDVVTIGSEIVIGDERYEAWGSFIRMAVLLEDGGSLKYTFDKAGKIQMGFVFQEDVKNLVSVSLLNKTIEFEQTK